MTKKFRWSPEDEQTLIDQIKKSPNNIRKACRSTALLVNKSADACKVHWYQSLSKRKTTETIFMTVGHQTMNKNRKNVHVHTSDNTEKLSKSKWNKILTALSKKRR